MAIVTLENISKSYDGVSLPAVDDISLRIEDGEFMVLLGPSGCGKSTTLRMIAGLETITSGTLSIDDEVMNKVPAKSRDIAMVFQSYALYPHMTVRNNLAFGLRRRGIDKAEIKTRIEAAAETLGLTEFLERKPFALSGGQRQRVALGRAIVRNPKVFLFDEPLSNLDAALRVHTRSELVKQHRKLGATMIYVTHDQVEAMTMGNRVCIMDRGRIVQVGAPMEVYRNPVNTFVASFLGSPPTNIVTGKLTGSDGGASVTALGIAFAMGGYSADALVAVKDGSVLFGIRPEDIYLETAPDRVAMKTEVVTVEPLGAETILLLAAPSGDEILARVGRETMLRPGEVCEVFLDLASAYLFEPASGNALKRAQGAAQPDQRTRP